jgi:hypothetical protein
MNETHEKEKREGKGIKKKEGRKDRHRNKRKKMR